MPAIGEQAQGYEALIDWFAGRDLALLFLLKAPHLFIAHGFSDPESEKHQRRHGIDPIQRHILMHPGNVHGRREQPDDEHLHGSDEHQVYHLEPKGPMRLCISTQR